MKVEIVLKKDLFENIGVEVSQLYCNINENSDVSINGSCLLKDSKKLEKHALDIKANLCDEQGNILYVMDSRSNLKFTLTNYEVFTLFMVNASRLFDINELHHIQLHPSIKKERIRNTDPFS